MGGTFACNPVGLPAAPTSIDHGPSKLMDPGSIGRFQGLSPDPCYNGWRAAAKAVARKLRRKAQPYVLEGEVRETGGNEVKRAGTAEWEAKGISGERRGGLGWREGETAIQTNVWGGAERSTLSTPRLHRSRLTRIRSIRRIQGNLRETTGASQLKHATMNGGRQLKPSPAGCE